MALLAVMLTCMMYTVGYTSGAVHVTGSGFKYGVYEFPSALPAWCLWHPSKPWTAHEGRLDVIYNWPYVSITWFILIYSFLTRAILIFVDIKDLLHTLFDFLGFPKLVNVLHRVGLPRLQPVESKLDNMDDSSIKYHLLRAIYMVWFICSHVYSSKIWEV